MKLSEKVSVAVNATMIALGDKVAEVTLSQEAIAAILREKGIAFSVVEVTEKATGTWSRRPGPRRFFGLLAGATESYIPEVNVVYQDIHIVGGPVIPDGWGFKLRYVVGLVKGRIVATPHIINSILVYAKEGGIHRSRENTPTGFEEFLRGLYPEYDLLSEEVVTLPTPEWVGIETWTGEDGYGGGNLTELVMFRSEAAEAWGRFVAAGAPALADGGGHQF